jgi:hypothetical protein
MLEGEKYRKRFQKIPLDPPLPKGDKREGRKEKNNAIGSDEKRP